MPPASRPGVGDVARAFPFHLVITPQLSIAAAGAGLTRIDPGLACGDRLDQHFTLDQPAVALRWELLAGSPETEFCLTHRKTRLELRGRMVVTEEDGPLVFLGTCWLDDAEQLADFGVVDVTALHAAPLPLADKFSPLRPVAPDADALAERCRRLEQCLDLHVAWSRALADSPDGDSALAHLATAIPAGLGWPGGGLWRRDAAGPVNCVARPTGAEPATPGETALAEKAFRTGAPVWSAADCAGAGGLAIPANTEAGTVAVLTAVSQTAEPETHELAPQLFLLAGQLSRFLARQQQQDRLTRLTSELSAIFQLSADGFVAFNGDGVLSYLNPTFARMTGLDRDELRGLREAAFEERLAGLLDPRQPARRAGNGDPVIHLCQPRTTILQRSWRDARDIDGRLIGRLLSFRDITLETELLRANGEFLANAAHELRTPLASIHGFVELLLKCDFPPEKRRGVLETIHSQSSRLSEIVDELLELARFDARSARDLDRQRQPLTPILRATVAELLIREDARQVRLMLPEDAASPWADIDCNRLKQALTNVLSNAYKYSPAGGEIALRLRQKRKSDCDWVGIAVRDHGIGMTAEEREHLFDRFFRARPAGNIPGTGLGMSMIKKIVDAHGGMVEVDSTPGVGTEVTLWLPANSPPETPA